MASEKIIVHLDESTVEVANRIRELQNENEFLRNRVIELQDKIKDFRSRDGYAEMTVFRMLKWGKKYISEAWDEYDERVERKQAWDEIVAKYTGEFEQ